MNSPTTSGQAASFFLAVADLHLLINVTGPSIWNWSAFFAEKWFERKAPCATSMRPVYVPPEILKKFVYSLVLCSSNSSKNQCPRSRLLGKRQKQRLFRGCCFKSSMYLVCLLIRSSKLSGMTAKYIVSDAAQNNIDKSGCASSRV